MVKSPKKRCSPRLASIERDRDERIKENLARLKAAVTSSAKDLFGVVQEGKKKKLRKPKSEQSKVQLRSRLERSAKKDKTQQEAGVKRVYGQGEVDITQLPATGEVFIQQCAVCRCPLLSA